MKLIRWLGGIAVFAVLAWGGWMVFHPEAETAGEAEPEIATEVSVRTIPLVKTTLREQVSAYGVAAPEPAGKIPAALAKMALPSSGLITEVNGVEGETVKKGDLLVSLDARVGQSQLDQANSALAFANQELERQKALIKIEGTSLKNLEGVENDRNKAALEVTAAETALSLLQIKAPISGIITRINVREGEAGDPTLTAVEILDPSRLVLQVQIPAATAAGIMLGQVATFLRQGSALPVEGKVVFVSPLVDAQTGAVEVRLSLPSESGIRPGEWLQTRIVSREKEDVLAAPVESVTMNEEGVPTIALVQGDTATRIPVKTGVRDGDLIEVEGEGLTAGASIVTEGAYGLPDETRVRILSSQ